VGGVADGCSEDDEAGADELVAFAQDLAAWTPSNEEMRAQFPEEPPAARTLHPDCINSTEWVGYSVEPMNIRLVRLQFDRYEFPAAEARAAELADQWGLRLVGVPFYTARFWCFRGVPK